MAFRKIRLGNVPLSYFNKRNLVFADIVNAKSFFR